MVKGAISLIAIAAVVWVFWMTWVWLRNPKTKKRRR